MVLEHCDAPMPHPASKGFLTLSAELEAVTTANQKTAGAAKPVGITINWARSVLETRSGVHHTFPPPPPLPLPLL